MQLVAAVLVYLLLVHSGPRDVDSKSMQVSSSNCCFKFAEKKISLQQIKCYRNTSSTCSYDGLIFKLKGGRESCVLKKAKWIQSYLKYIKPCLQKRI